MGASGYARVDQAALAELLQVSQLFDQDLSFEVARLAGCFPAVVRRNMFVEYELGERRVPSGFGLGFPWGLRDRYIATDHWFPRTGVGRAIESALSADPFVSDHAVYLNLLSDDDPDWVEYDIVEGRLDMAPVVFVRPPSRFRTISTREHVRSLCELLPGASPGGEFAGMLDVLVGLGPAGIYRVGLAQQRGQGWWRALITNLRDDQVAVALGSRGATDFEELLELARMLYFERTTRRGRASRCRSM